MLIKPVSRRKKGILLEHLFHPARHSGYPMLALTNLHGPEIRGSKGFEDSSACLRRSLLRPIFLVTKLVGFLPNQLRFVEEAAMIALRAKLSIHSIQRLSLGSLSRVSDLAMHCLPYYSE
jgi:hypothetical protein